MICTEETSWSGYLLNKAIHCCSRFDKRLFRVHAAYSIYRLALIHGAGRVPKFLWLKLDDMKENLRCYNKSIVSTVPQQCYLRVVVDLHELCNTHICRLGKGVFSLLWIVPNDSALRLNVLRKRLSLSLSQNFRMKGLIFEKFTNKKKGRNYWNTDGWYFIENDEQLTE